MRLILWCALPATILALVGAAVTFRSDDPNPHVPIALFLWSLVWCAIVLCGVRSRTESDEDTVRSSDEPMSLNKISWWRVTGWLYPVSLWIWILLGTFFGQFTTCASWFGSYATGRLGYFLCAVLPSLAVFILLMVVTYVVVCVLRGVRQD